MPVTLCANGKLYRNIAGLSCDVLDSDHFVTVYDRDPADDNAMPVATMQRRRVYSDSPVWTVYALDGVKLAETRGKLWTVVGLLKDTARALELKECKAVCEAANAVGINAHPHHGAGYGFAVITDYAASVTDRLVSLDELRALTAAKVAELEAAKPAPVERREVVEPFPVPAPLEPVATLTDRINAARAAGNWDLAADLCELRRSAEVTADESCLAGLTADDEADPVAVDIAADIAANNAAVMAGATVVPNIAAPAPDRVTVTRTASGWHVELHKAAGLNKGRTTIATVCGGLLGQRVADAVALETAISHGIGPAAIVRL